MHRFLFSRPDSALSKSISISLAIALGFASVASPVAAGYNDPSRTYQPRDYNNSYNRANNYSPPSRLDLQVSNLNTVLAMRNMVPKPAPIAPMAVKPIFTPVIKFEPTKLDLKREVPQAVKPTQSMAKPQGFLAKVEGVLKGLGKAVAAPFQAIARAVAKFFKSPEAPKASPSQMDVARQFTNLQPMGQGVFETRGGRTYALGMSWEGGSQFKVEGDQLKLISGTAEDKGFGPIKREDGTLLPVKFVGGKDGITPVGIDFSYLEPNARLTVTAPLEIQGLGSIQPGKMVFRGSQSTPTGTSGRFDFEGGQIQLEKNAAHGFGLESPATIAHASFTLEAGLMRMKSAVLENGKTKTYVREGMAPLDISGMDDRANILAESARDTNSHLSKVATDLEHRSKAVSHNLDNAGQQTGIDAKVEFEFKGAFKNLAEESKAISKETQELTQAMAEERYDGAKEQLETLQQRQEQVQHQVKGLETQAEAFRDVQRGLREVTAGLGKLAGKADVERMRTEGPIPDKELSQRAEKYFPEEKASISAGADKTLNAIKDLVRTGAMAPEEGTVLGAQVMAMRDQMLAAVPKSGTGLMAKEAVAEGFNKSYETGKKAVDRSADLAFFGWMGKVAETHPTVGQTVGIIGLRTAQTVDGVNKAVGIVGLCYFAVTATITTGVSLGTAWVGKKALEALGVDKETASAFAFLAGLFVGSKVGKNAKVQATEGQISRNIFAKSQYVWSKFNSLVRNAAEPILNERGRIAIRGRVKGSMASRTMRAIQTPYGLAIQEKTPLALNALKEVKHGAKLYRIGAIDKQQVLEAQFWSLENPLATKGFAKKMGLPNNKTSKDDLFVIQARLRPGASVVTRGAPGIGSNKGGDIEAVINPGDVQIDWFHLVEKRGRR